MVSFDNYSGDICAVIIYKISISKRKIKYLSIENVLIDSRYKKTDLSIYLTYVIFNFEMKNIQRIYCRNIFNFYDFVLIDIFNFKKLNDQEKYVIKDIFNDTNEYHNVVVEVEDPDFTDAIEKINTRLNTCANEQTGGSNSYYLNKYKKYKKKYRDLQNIRQKKF